MKTKMKDEPSVKVLLHVEQYGVNIIAGRLSGPADNPSGAEMALLTLYGVSDPPQITFRVRVYPDATKLPEATYLPAQNVVEMSFNWCQFERVMSLLATAQAAHAQYRVDDGKVYADVHGEFSRAKRKSKTRKRR